jgi:hypothetical protein
MRIGGGPRHTVSPARGAMLPVRRVGRHQFSVPAASLTVDIAPVPGWVGYRVSRSVRVKAPARPAAKAATASTSRPSRVFVR